MVPEGENITIAAAVEEAVRVGRDTAVTVQAVIVVEATAVMMMVAGLEGGEGIITAIIVAATVAEVAVEVVRDRIAEAEAEALVVVEEEVAIEDAEVVAATPLPITTQGVVAGVIMVIMLAVVAVILVVAVALIREDEKKLQIKAAKSIVVISVTI